MGAKAIHLAASDGGEKDTYCQLRMAMNETSGPIKYRTTTDISKVTCKRCLAGIAVRDSLQKRNEKGKVRMVDVVNKLRVQKLMLQTEAAGRKITVNTTFRRGVGYRAALQGRPGALCDSVNSPEEAIGKLIISWLTEELN